MEIDLMILVPLVAILGIIYHYLTKGNKYFHEKPIPSLATEPLFGSTRRLLLKQTAFTDFVINIYNKYPLVKVFGMIDTVTPMFVVRDPELIKKITVKDFEYFMNHRPVFGNNDDPHNTALFGKTLVSLNDQRWRDMRATLSPAFTGSKMRQMFELIVECSNNMAQYYKEQIRKNGVGSQEHEMKDVFTRYANDVIATCAFGIKVDSFKNTENDFYVNGKKMMAFNRPVVMFRMLGFRIMPKLMSKFNLDLFDREQRDFFSEIIKDTVRTRDANGIVRPDMVHLLMQARKGALKHQRETEEREEVKGFATVEESEVGQAQASKGLHHDPQYYPNPSKFDPERFSEENREKINPSTYLPFGIGPRNCIGSRFALMEVKAIVYYMLREFSFERTPNTQVPLRLAKGFAGMRSEKGVFVEFRPRKQTAH
uniref:Cytochrome P450 n=1 Tax=Anopheles christyi TaxID=43041 RepID=A0A182K775_9DIPT